jgi:hypothetical protein
MTDIGHELLARARDLHSEATDLLRTGGLLSAIEAFGDVRVGGSWALGLMTRPEIDLYLKLDNERDTARFFAVGAALVASYRVVRAAYSNHFTRGLPGFASGLFWGVSIDYADRRWKVDLWGEGPEPFAEHQAAFDVLAQALRNVAPENVLGLKEAYREGDGYRDGVTGLSIYRAALAGARDVDGFLAWRRRAQSEGEP